MVIIYDQDKTYIKNSLPEASHIINELYGEKLGSEAINALRDAREGSSWRKNGGSLIQIVGNEKAEWIKNKETELGMM